MNPKRPYPSVPLVNLGENFKKVCQKFIIIYSCCRTAYTRTHNVSLTCILKVSDYMSRIKTIPDILELDQLTISGDVCIGAKVTLKVRKSNNNNNNKNNISPEN